VNQVALKITNLTLSSVINTVDNETAIYNNNGTVTIEHCFIIGNLSEVVEDSAHINGYFGGMGGAIINNGSMSIHNSILSNNMARDYTSRSYGLGGAIYNNGSLTINKSTFSNNYALTSGSSDGARGGAIYNASGTLTINDSYFYTNGALDINSPELYGSGGAIYNAGGNLILKSSALVLNMAKDAGGAVYNAAGASLVNNSLIRNESNLGNGGAIFSAAAISLTNNTLVVNNAGNTGGGVFMQAGSLNMVNNLISNSLNGGDCVLNGAASLSVNLNNLVRDGSCSAALTSDPKLDSNLLDNGGPTLTMALLSGSPAINAGNNSGCPATDQRGVNRDSNCDIGAFEVDNSIPTVTINQASTQADPTGSDPLLFTVIFSKKIDSATFSAADISLSGTAAGPLTVDITEITPNNGTTFRATVSGMSSSGTVISSIPAGAVKDFANHDNTDSGSTDNSIIFNFTDLGVSNTSLRDFYEGSGPDQFTVNFNRDVNNPAGDSDHDDVTNPDNYLLVNKGNNGLADTVSCSAGVQADDVRFPVDSVSYNSAARQATVHLSSPLPIGFYRLLLCGSTSIIDLFGNPLNNGSDYGFDLRVSLASSGGLPATGFAPGRITYLPRQSADSAYDETEMELEIPSLHLKMNIVGVPQTGSSWDVSWLESDAGWLYGSAYPTWAGNTVLTAHVWDALNHPGPFARLKELNYGEKFYIHAFGQTYIYEVRENKPVAVNDLHDVLKSETFDWVTLLTCESYNPATNQYLARRLVRAVRIAVK
ncbi:MAG: sortase, partial [Anaerolineae bacterium]|nr:sortase [Anaerolineae bacterium]